MLCISRHTKGSKIKSISQERPLEFWFLRGKSNGLVFTNILLCAWIIRRMDLIDTLFYITVSSSNTCKSMVNRNLHHFISFPFITAKLHMGHFNALSCSLYYEMMGWRSLVPGLGGGGTEVDGSMKSIYPPLQWHVTLAVINNALWEEPEASHVDTSGKVDWESGIKRESNMGQVWFFYGWNMARIGLGRVSPKIQLKVKNKDN